MTPETPISRPRRDTPPTGLARMHAARPVQAAAPDRLTTQEILSLALSGLTGPGAGLSRLFDRLEAGQ